MVPRNSSIRGYIMPLSRHHPGDRQRVPYRGLTLKNPTKLTLRILHTRGYQCIPAVRGTAYGTLLPHLQLWPCLHSLVFSSARNPSDVFGFDIRKKIRCEGTDLVDGIVIIRSHKYRLDLVHRRAACSCVIPKMLPGRFQVVLRCIQKEQKERSAAPDICSALCSPLYPAPTKLANLSINHSIRRHSWRILTINLKKKNSW